jgi:hypothetical protein
MEMEWSQMGWDLEADLFERRSCEKTRVMRVMVGGLSWMRHMDWVHPPGHGLRALRLCAFYALLQCESVVDRRGMLE